MAKKLKRFHILLDDESLLYFPGSFLTGKVLLELEEDTPASGEYLCYEYDNNKHHSTSNNNNNNCTDYHNKNCSITQASTFTLSARELSDLAVATRARF